MMTEKKTRQLYSDKQVVKRFCINSKYMYQRGTNFIQ